MREYVLDQSRNLMDQPGAEEAGAGSGDGAFGERGFVPPQPLDPAQAAALLPYFRNAQKFAPPTRQAEIKRKVLARARKEAIEELQAEAAALGANAVVGVDLDYEVIGSNGSMLMVSASGTAVKI